MSSQHEIVTPEVLLATGKNIGFRILPGDEPILEEEGDDPQESFRAGDFDWFTHGLAVPVVASERFLPFRVTSPDFQLPTNIFVTIAKIQGQPRLNMYLGKFGSLTKLFQHGTLHVIVSGTFASYSFNHKIAAIPIKGREDEDDHAEIIVVDSFLENFWRNVAIVDQAEFSIKMFWKFSFTDAKLDYVDNVLISTIEMQHVEGTVSLVSKTGSGVKISKGLLAASSPKFKAQFEQDCAKELTLTIDGQVAMSEESLNALLKCIVNFSLQQPLAKCAIALDLLMAAEYHMFEEMKTVMQDILLAKPSEWYDLETSVRLFTFAIMVCSSQGEAREDTTWHNLKWKALLVMKSFSIEEVQNCAAIGGIVVEPIGLEMLQMLLKIT